MSVLLKEKSQFDYDFIVIGSGFGGSVSALRLVEKGYSVLVIEKGKEYKSDDFPKSNWNLKRWLWLPSLRFFGFFKITFFKHVGILSGVGVGGGSLVYANTLPIPKDEFFNSGSWSNIADWKTELMPYYERAKKMLGVAKNPRAEYGDEALRILAKKMDRENDFELTDVGVFFGEPKKIVPDPYFGGDGPDRAGCHFCGACMIGCRHNAKNSLDKNYLYLARKQSAKIISESEVYDVKPIITKRKDIGYVVRWRSSTKLKRRKGNLRTRGVVFAGGVLGTVPLLLKLKTTNLPELSDVLGRGVRTNSESLLGVTAPQKEKVFSDGVAISSIFHTDEHSHLEPVRYPSGSGFWRLQIVPLLEGKNAFIRALKVVYELVRHPLKWSKLYFVRNWAQKTQILLFMQTINSTLKFEKGFFRMRSKLDTGEAPTAFMPQSRVLAREYAEIVGGTPGALLSETVLGIPTTAHILGGALMGESADNGVIDKYNRVFGYENMYICDGSAVSANPGVNPSLTITAITEHAMEHIAERET